MALSINLAHCFSNASLLDCRTSISRKDARESYITQITYMEFETAAHSCRPFPLFFLLNGLATRLPRGKTGEGIKAREPCNTWQRGSLAGQDSVQSASFYKKPISNHMHRKDNDTTEQGFRCLFDNDRLKLR